MSEVTITRRAKRKISVLELIGNLIIWLSPLVVMLIVIIYNWSSITTMEAKYHVELWISIVLFVMMIIYYKIIKKKIKEKIQADKINEEKTRPLICLANGILNLMPYVFGILVFDFLNSLCQPIFKILVVMLCCEAIGRILLFIDSFKESEYTY